MKQCRTCIYANMMNGRVDCHGETPKVIVLPIPAAVRGIGKQSRVVTPPQQEQQEVQLAPMSIRGTVNLNDQACPRYIAFGSAEAGLSAAEVEEQSKWRIAPPPQAQNATTPVLVS